MDPLLERLPAPPGPGLRIQEDQQLSLLAWTRCNIIFLSLRTRVHVARPISRVGRGSLDDYVTRNSIDAFNLSGRAMLQPAAGSLQSFSPTSCAVRAAVNSFRGYRLKVSTNLNRPRSFSVKL